MHLLELRDEGQPVFKDGPCAYIGPQGHRGPSLSLRTGMTTPFCVTLVCGLEEAPLSLDKFRRRTVGVDPISGT